MKRVFYVYRSARGNIYQNWLKGFEPDHSLYGLNYLRDWGYKAEYSDISFSKYNFLSIINFLTQKISVKLSSVGFRLDQAILLLPKLRKTNMVIAVSDSAGLPILLLKKLKLFNKPITLISIGLANELVTRRKLWSTKYYLSVLKEADIVICHSPEELHIFRQMLPEMIDQIKFIPFGIDNKYFNISKKVERYIISIGRDRSRDYKLLSKIAKRLPDEKFIIVTSRSNVKNISFTDNVQVYYDLPYTKVMELYSEAKIVFLPLFEMNRASGQIAFLECMATNNIVIVSNVKGIKEVYRNILTHSNVILCKPEDVISAQQSIEKALKLKRRRMEFPREYTSQAYAEQIEKLIKKYA